MKKYLSGSILVFQLITCLSRAQFIANPSFEGPAGASRIPPGWSTCELFSTPDTQPGAFGCTTLPSHGNTYTSLCGRTKPAPSAGYCEDIETELKRPLRNGICYRLKLDLAMSGSFFVDDFDRYMFNNPLRLTLFGNTGRCGKSDTLLKIAPVSHEDWKTYEFTITPAKGDVTFLRFVSSFIKPDSSYFGNILIDNIQLSEFIEESVTYEKLVVAGSWITLNASEGKSYSWSPDSALSCASCQSPVTSVYGNVTYTVVRQMEGQCVSRSEVFILRLLKADDLFVPNVITPNGDGFNDRFVIRSLPPNCSLQITNRLGEVLFSSDNYDNSWGGLYRGQLLPPDSYWYVLTFDKNQDPLKGFVYLKQAE